MPKSPLQKMLVLTLLAGVSLVLFIFDGLIPNPIPGGKLGLSQIVTLFLLYQFGWLEALLVLLVRVIVGNLILGSLFSPVFILGLLGGLGSLLVMIVFLNWNTHFSCVGVSIAGAFSHNLFQLLSAYLFFIRNVTILLWFPYFSLIGIVAGLFIGLITYFLLKSVDLNVNRLIS